MKFGVLGFGYDHFSGFGDQLSERGFYTANLGDNTQTIAMRRLYRACGVGDDEIVLINRDRLSEYDGDEACLIMNGVFFEHCFPVPPKIRPIFMGFHAKEAVLRRFHDHLRGFQPIGCRDGATAELCARYGIEAFVTGCVTLTLDPVAPRSAADRLLVVHGDGVGALPAAILGHVPRDLLARAEFIHHRLPVFEHPLSPATCAHLEAYEMALLSRYVHSAALVLTPLHHVAAPCMAMGIPVIVCRTAMDDRFSFLATLTPIHTPETFGDVDWSPQPAAVEAVSRAFVDRVAAMVAGMRQGGGRP